MTDKVTIESLQAEILRIKSHGEDLLSERKAEKQRREAAESALQALTDEHHGLIAKLDDLTLAGPVLRALEDVTSAPPKHGRRLLEDAGITFAIGKAGIATAIDGEDEIALPDLYQHLRKKCDTPEGMAAFGWIIRGCGASGGGAPGGSRAIKYQPEPEKRQNIVANALGLR